MTDKLFEGIWRVSFKPPSVDWECTFEDDFRCRLEWISCTGKATESLRILTNPEVEAILINYDIPTVCGAADLYHHKK